MASIYTIVVVNSPKFSDSRENLRLRWNLAAFTADSHKSLKYGDRGGIICQLMPSFAHMQLWFWFELSPEVTQFLFSSNCRIFAVDNWPRRPLNRFSFIFLKFWGGASFLPMVAESDVFNVLRSGKFSQIGGFNAAHQWARQFRNWESRNHLRGVED